jgi:hypothetical protein
MEPALALLAVLLHAQTPGRSAHAKVVLESCDDACQTTRACNEEVLYCRAPEWSARHQRFVRFETFAEGVRRYAMLAEVMHETAQRMTWQPDGHCPPPRHGDGDLCSVEHRAHPWSGTERQLELLLATVVAHESSLRRDVHEGTTRGDCDYTDRGGRREVIEGSCRSHCLGQVRVLPGDRTARGYTADEIVGLDRVSTARCIETVVDHLSAAHDLCVAQNNGRQGAYPACTMGVYGGVTSWGKDPRIALRVETWGEMRSILAGAKPLPPQVLAALGAAPPR